MKSVIVLLRHEKVHVAPFVGAWIEILYDLGVLAGSIVAPFVGAWIEILRGQRCVDIGTVAPFVGAWIEIAKKEKAVSGEESLPSWERGLKCL